MLTPGQIAYREYLKSDHWKELKARKSRKGVRKTCPGCGLHKPLQLHHMLYRDTFDATKLYDLMWLCAGCHKLFHEAIGAAQVPEQYRSNRAWLKGFTKSIIRNELHRRGLWKHGDAPNLVTSPKSNARAARIFLSNKPRTQA